MDEVSVERTRRRRRKSSRRRAASWPEYWRSAEFAQHLFIAMCLIGAAYAGTILWETRHASMNYPPTKIGMTESEVRYVLGPPRSIEQDGALYRYSERGRELAVRFSPAGRMESISCWAGADEPPTCPRIRGLRIGSSEYDVLLTLGAPSREVFRGNDKTLYYDGMGMVFQMRPLEVRELGLREGARFSGYFPRALFSLVP